MSQNVLCKPVPFFAISIGDRISADAKFAHAKTNVDWPGANRDCDCGRGMDGASIG